ncbi:MAG: radical SAM protein [Candidatus Aminicenantes bacterium]|nr:radical SAM protein [Candidatus Aminicenantes bacterium]
MKKLMERDSLIYEAGWHGEEHDGFYSFRWMTREAKLRLYLRPKKGPRLLEIIAGHSFSPEKPKLKIFIQNNEIGEREIDSAFSAYLFPLPEIDEVSVRLVLDRIFQVPNDTRDLGIMIRSIRIVNLEEIDEPIYGEGWYGWERGELFPFRWMKAEAILYLPSFWQNSFLMLPISSEYYNQKQILTIFYGNTELARWPLLYQWNTYSLKLPKLKSSGNFELEKTKTILSREDNAGGIKLIFKLNCLFPGHFHLDDQRELGVRVGPISWHHDEERHLDLVFFHENAVKNYEEMMAGQTILSSFPTNLGIDLYSRCNISPPCVYCLYDRMKVLEGQDQEAIIDDRTLASYGPFFKAARSIVNCSFGEPLLHPRFEEILEFCASRGKIVELSTNGQAFTARTIKALLGKPIYLYISLDAATPETYAKIRNERFNEIVSNLIKLNEARKKTNGLPKIFMVFMPMRVNFHELEEYFRLCQRVDADALVLRPLLYLENPGIREKRGGYLFDYEKEMLSPAEIRLVINQAEELSKKYKIPLANQFEFGQVAEPGSQKF